MNQSNVNTPLTQQFRHLINRIALADASEVNLHTIPE